MTYWLTNARPNVWMHATDSVQMDGELDLADALALT